MVLRLPTCRNERILKRGSAFEEHLSSGALGERTDAGSGRHPAITAGMDTLAIEMEALRQLGAAMLDHSLATPFIQVADMIVQAQGRVVVSGMGKSGLIGRKIAATLASTGTPAFFLHPAEASHGDLGMVSRGDIVIALSWSGETDELSDVISYCRRFEIALVAITANRQSSLAQLADIVLLLPQVEEACPNRLAPTSSTIVQAALGDALAVALIKVRGFSTDDFRVFHPRGRLGAQLLRVEDLMSGGEQVPRVDENATILSAMLEMSLKRFGITAVVDAKHRLVGAFTDGDLRRSLTVASVDARIGDHMSLSPLTIAPQKLASEALADMNAQHVTQLFVSQDGDLVGIVHLHDILQAGII